MRGMTCLQLSADFLGAKLFSVSSQLGRKTSFMSKDPRPVQHGFGLKCTLEKGQVIGEIADTALLQGC